MSYFGDRLDSGIVDPIRLREVAAAMDTHIASIVGSVYDEQARTVAGLRKIAADEGMSQFARDFASGVAASMTHRLVEFHYVPDEGLDLLRSSIPVSDRKPAFDREEWARQYQHWWLALDEPSREHLAWHAFNHWTGRITTDGGYSTHPITQCVHRGPCRPDPPTFRYTP